MDVGLPALLQAAPRLKIEYMDQADGRSGWILSLLGDLTGVLVPPFVIEVLSAASSPVTPAHLLFHLTSQEHPEALVAQVLEGLVARSFLVDADRLGSVDAELLHLRSRGWDLAGEYHFHTFGYPFLEYDDRGLSKKDGEGMRRYAAEAIDSDRALRRVDAKERFALTESSVDLVSHAGAAQALEGSAPAQALDRAKVLGLVQLGIGAVATRRLPISSSAPLLLKTSPSGGSRHPTETYALVSGVAGMRDGWYHIEHRAVELEYLGPDLSGTFALLDARQSADPQMALIFTCRFARNRYRYREPRTFRTIHMDAGHLLGTVELLASSVGLTARPRHVGDISEKLAETLDLQRFEEWPLAALVIQGE